ncbi:MAG: hypothetical protein Q8P02_01665, partial [Candidatus Micrarchaeota archaeon]|nr:hypothetical protein [Candidatus Micrarchaeota archaeon]
MPPESLRDHVFTAFDTLGIHRAPSSARKGTFHLLGMHDTHLQDVRGPFRLLADVRRPLRESPVVEHDGALYVHSLRGLVSVDLSSEHAQAMAAFKTLKAQLFKMGAQLDFHV